MSAKETGKGPELEFESNAITVAVRARPFNAREVSMNALQCLDFGANKKSVVIWEKGNPAVRKNDASPADGGKNHAYTFDHAYDSDTHQSQVYEDIGKPVLIASLAGFNTCIFAYGQTGSGKSYAMMGPQGGRDAQKDPGVIPRLCTALFEEISQRRKTNAEEIAEAGDVEAHEKPPKLEFAVDVQYLEIYQERVRCLINPKKDNLKVRQHPVTGVFVENLTEMDVNSYDEIWKLIDDGNNVRHVATTNMNDQSSRSHAIFVVNLTQRRITLTKDGTETTTERKAKINLVDLAGSERAKSTGAQGDTLKEGSNINKSLTILGLVISGLAELSKNPTAAKKPFIPYRDSTLTWLLKESLGGNSKTFMVSTLSPAHINFEETLSTLRYADRAKAIVTKACVNESASDRKIRELTEEVQKLQEIIRRYEEKQAQQERIGQVVPKLKLGLPAGPGSPAAGKAKMPVPKVQKVGGPRSDAKADAQEPQQKQHQPRLARHRSHHRELPLITPRSAIDKVVTEDEVIASDEDGEFMEDTPLMTLGTPRYEDDVVEARRQLELAEGLRAKFSLSDTQRHRNKEHEMLEHDEAMRNVTVVKASRADPYILNLDRAGDWVMATLSTEVTMLGSAAAPPAPVINCLFVTVDGEGVEAHHCSLLKNQITNQVVLRPVAGCDTYIDPPDEPITEDVVLNSGQQFYLGDELFGFKFEDPAEKPLVTSRKRSAMSIIKKDGAGGGRSLNATVTLPTSAASDVSGGGTPGSMSPASTSPPPPVSGLRLNLPGASSNSSDNPSGSPDARHPGPASARPTVPSLNIGGERNLTRRSSQHIDPQQLGQRPRSSTLAGSNHPPAAVQIRTPRITGGTIRGGASHGTGGAAVAGSSGAAGSGGGTDENTCQFRHTFIFLGKAGCGKTASRINLAKEDKWLSGFFKKEVPPTEPTFAFDSNRVQAGALSKADVTLLELSGNEAFTTLEPLIPDRRVTFCICFRLGDQCDLPYFHRYLEFITCHSPSNETTIVLLATCRDEVRGSDGAVLESLAETEAQLSSYLVARQPVETRRPRFIAKFAVSNKLRTVLSPSQRITKMPELLAWFGDHAVTRCKVDPDFPHGMVPLRVMTIGRKLGELKTQGRYVLTTSEYKALARMIDVRYERHLGDLHKHTQLLHSWGLVHHHYRHTNMKRFVIVDTKWVFTLIATLSCCIDTSALAGASAAAASGGTPVHSPAQILDVLNNAPAGGLIRAGLGPYSPKTTAFGDRLPFSISALKRADPDGLICRGVLTIPVAKELFRALMREKSLAETDLDSVVELLENYDLVARGSRLKQWASHRQRMQQHARGRGASIMDDTQPSSPERREDSRASLDRLVLDGDNDDDDDDAPEAFYLVPACFQAPLPQPLTLHVTPILFGPHYRFSMNMVPPYFFPRFVARISRYAQRLYLGPAKCNTGDDVITAPLVSGSFWANCVWIIDSSSARAFVRMVNRSLFITFHDSEDESPFHNGLLEVVRFLVHESPGMQCEEAVLCRKSVLAAAAAATGGGAGGASTPGGDAPERGERAWEELWVPISDNVNSLEKLKEREEMALRTARGAGPVRDANGVPIGEGGRLLSSDSDDDVEGADGEGGGVAIVRNPRDAFDEDAVFEQIQTDCFVDEEVMRKIQQALRLVKKGRTMDDRERGATTEGVGMDQLVDALAHA